MVIHDLQCTDNECAEIQYNALLKDVNTLPACRCGAAMEICWSTPRKKQLVSVHSRERVIVWRNPKTGRMAYPPKNDAPMPDRYRNAGYERHEMPHLHDVTKFEKQHKVVNEKINFNSGNGV